jgi:hypothetical protein
MLKPNGRTRSVYALKSRDEGRKMGVDSIRSDRPSNSVARLNNNSATGSVAETMTRDVPTSNDGYWSSSVVRTTHSEARRSHRGISSGARTTNSDVSGNAGIRKVGEITTTAATTIVGGATTGMAIDDSRIETATNGGDGKRTHGASGKPNSAGVKMIASVNGKFAISTSAKCVA